MDCNFTIKELRILRDKFKVWCSGDDEWALYKKLDKFLQIAELRKELNRLEDKNEKQ